MSDNKIGPTIWVELAEAGVTNLGFTIDFITGALNAPPGFDPDIAQKVLAVIATHNPNAATTAPPDGPTLSDWRVGLTLWGRMDDVTTKVSGLIGSANAAQAMLGKIARERLEYANNVLRTQLMQLKDVLGFTEADVDESLHRAHQVSLGDLSGVWPLPASPAPST